MATANGHADEAVQADLEQPLNPGAAEETLSEHCDHVHYSHRTGWLRAFILGANDGLVSVASIMMGVGGGSDSLHFMRLAAIAGWIAGALSMACGEYISVASQKDTEEADIEKERTEQAKGPEAQQRELDELTQIYIHRGLSPALARQVAVELTEKDVIRAHARDELGIDVDDLANPLQASVVSALAFTLGALIPLLAGGFIADSQLRLIAIIAATTLGLALFGATGAVLGGSRYLVGTIRVLIGGWLAMGATYGVGRVFGVSAT